MFNFIFKLLFSLIFIVYSKTIFSYEIGNYSPTYEQSTIVEIDNVIDLVENVKKVIPPLKTRGIGANIFRNVAPATVIIAAEGGMGSGFLINAQGSIITNYHVISDGNNSFHPEVSLVFCPIDMENLEKSIVFRAKVIKVDKSRDLALLQMNSPVNNKISKVVYIDSNTSNVDIGMDVHAIGHPEGQYCTYTKGVVSQIRGGYEWQYSSDNLHKATVIQTQTPINPGNSGGPLINDMGKVIGINTFKNPDATGINYAVSSSEIQDFIVNGPANPISPKADVCDSETPIQEADINENGIIDTYGYDRDCNNIADFFEMDENEDGTIDIIFIDNDQNGIPEISIDFALHEEGEYKGKYFARWVYDTDEDGTPEEICFDIDLDETIDQCRSLS